MAADMTTTYGGKTLEELEALCRERVDSWAASEAFRLNCPFIIPALIAKIRELGAQLNRVDQVELDK